MPDAATIATLLDEAATAKQHAQPTYSEYSVGAAILTDDGSIYTGCNVENATFTLTIHAEQNALTNAISDGHTSFQALAISTTSMDGVPPCGVCRQTIAEYCPDSLPIYSETEDDYNEYTLGELFPEAFRVFDAE